MPTSSAPIAFPPESLRGAAAAIHALAESLGLPPPPAGQGDSLLLFLDGPQPLSLSVSPSPDDGEVLLEATIGQLDGPRDAIRLMAALACNLEPQEGRIGLDLQALCLVHLLRLPMAQAGAPPLLDAVRRFAERSEQLAQAIAQAAADFTPAEQAEVARRAGYDGAPLAERAMQPVAPPGRGFA